MAWLGCYWALLGLQNCRTGQGRKNHKEVSSLGHWWHGVFAPVWVIIGRVTNWHRGQDVNSDSLPGAGICEFSINYLQIIHVKKTRHYGSIHRIIGFFYFIVFHRGTKSRLSLCRLNCSSVANQWWALRLHERENIHQWGKNHWRESVLAFWRRRFSRRIQRQTNHGKLLYQFRVVDDGDEVHCFCREWKSSHAELLSVAPRRNQP